MNALSPRGLAPAAVLPIVPRPSSQGRIRSRAERLAAALLWVLCMAGVAGSAADARTVKVAALGDSLTAGQGVAPGKSFTDQLQAALRAKGHDVEIVNAGVSGDTAADGLERYDWSVPKDVDALIVELGANDMLRGVEPAVTKKSLDAILAKLKERNIAVLLCGMRAAPNMGTEFADAFDTLYDELAKKYDVVFYPFFLDGVAAQAKLAQRDGIHPNAAGVDMIVANILSKAEELIARLRAKRGS